MRRTLLCLTACFVSAVALAEDPAPPDYSKQIAPLFRKHCTACHNGDDREGELSLESFTDLKKGGKRGPSVQPGDLKSSRLFLMVSGPKPKMPPEENDPLTSDEVALLKTWIETGARGPAGDEPISKTLNVPKISSAKLKAKPVGAIAVSPDGRVLAIARFGTVEVRIMDTPMTMRQLLGLVAMVQCVVAGISAEIDRGAYLVDCHPMIARQNKWHAVRYGLDATLVDPDTMLAASARQMARRTLDLCRPVADHLGCATELGYCDEILQDGNGAQSQRHMLQNGESPQDVVKGLLDATGEPWNVP